MNYETYIQLIEPLIKRFQRNQSLEQIAADFEHLKFYKEEDLKAAVEQIVTTRAADTYPPLAEILEIIIEQVSKTGQTRTTDQDCQACRNQGYYYDPEARAAVICRCTAGQRKRAALKAIAAGAEYRDIVKAVQQAPPGQPPKVINYEKKKEGTWQETFSYEQKVKRYLQKTLDALKNGNRIKSEK